MFESKGFVARPWGSRTAGTAPAGSRTGAKAWGCLLMALFVIGAAHAQDYRFTTVAGGFTGDGGLATDAHVGAPTGLARDAQGNLYVGELQRHRIRKISPNGVITTFAGTGAAGYSGNVSKAGMATMNGPLGIAIDAMGNVFFSDSNNNRVRKIMPGGVISTVAGNGSAVSSGDGGAATSAGIARPYGLAFDAAGNLYVSESLGHRIRMITPAGTISTFAGNGIAAFGGDGGAATSASLNQPAVIAFDAADNLYVADTFNHRVRKVSPGGVISTVAGAPVTGSLSFPYSVAIDATGSLYIGDAGCGLYRLPPGGALGLVAGGDGTCAYNGDGMQAVDATVDFVEGMAFAPNGDLYYADSGQYRVRKIDAGGTISTAAGMGSMRDGSAAVATFSLTTGLGVDGAGNVYVADSYNNHRIRKITPSQSVSTFAGNGQFSSFGDGGPAFLAALSYPRDAAADAAGNVYIAERIGNRVRRVSTDGTIVTVAGTGSTGSTGDGGAATSARLARPNGVAVDAAGNIYIADTNNHRVRMVTPGGIITTVAGNGVMGFAGDDGAATAASLWSPYAVAVDAAGNLFIADYGNLRVRKVTSAGVISTVAGSGAFGYGGDGGDATAAELTRPTGIAVDASGNLFIAGGALRRVATDGTISTIRGLTYSAYDVAAGNNGALYVSVLGGRVLKGTPPAIPTRKPF